MQKAVVDVSGLRKRGAARGRPKGRHVDPAAVDEVRALLGDAPRRRDLLIEFLHRIQDAFGSISAAHVVALAQEMSLAMTEVYEVATFYHHFDVVKEGETPPPALTVRVCETLSCRLAGSEALHAALASACGARRARAPRPVHRTLRARAGRRRRSQSGRSRHRSMPCRTRWHSGAPSPPFPGTSISRPTAGTAVTACSPPACAARPGRGRADGDGGLRAARSGRRRVPGGTQVAHRARRAGAAADGGQPRRRRARDVQGSPLSGTRPAPLHRGHADRGVGCRHRRCLCLSARRICRVPRDSDPRARGARGRASLRAAADPSAPRRRRVHLRRRVGDDRVDRRQARHAAAASALRRAGRPLRAADARAQHGDALLGARHPRKGRGVVLRAGAPRPEGPALVLGVRPRRQARRTSRAGGHHRPRADRRALRRDAAGPRVLRLSSRRRFGRDPAGVAGRHSARFRHAAAARLLHRLGRRHRAVAARPRPRRRAQPDALFRGRIVRPVHAMPRRHREGRGAARTGRPGTCRCSTSCRGRWPTRRSAAWVRRRPTPLPASSATFPRNL